MENNELLSIKTMMTEMIDKQNKMQVQLNDMDKTLTQLNYAVIGNEIYGIKGMIPELRDVQKYVHRDKMTKSKIMGGLTVIGVLWTMLWEFLKHKVFN